MRTLSPAAVTLLGSGNVVLATLVKLAFPGGTVALNSSTFDLVYSGDTYKAAAGLGTISPIQEQPGQTPGAQLELQQIDSTFISLALDDADQVQGAPVTISTAVIDTTSYQVVEVEIDWTGYADTMSISEDGQTASIMLTAESKAVDLLRGRAMFYNDSDQQLLVPGDRYFEYVASQSDKPVVWPAKEWFQK